MKNIKKVTKKVATKKIAKKTIKKEKVWNEPKFDIRIAELKKIAQKNGNVAVLITTRGKTSTEGMLLIENMSGGEVLKTLLKSLSENR